MRTDFLINGNNDLLISNGDFVIGDAALYQARTILESTKGEIRQFPLIGAGLVKFIGSTLDENILKQIAKDELAKDGLKLKSISTSKVNKETTLNIELY